MKGHYGGAWNANLGYVEKVTDQFQTTNEALSKADPYLSLEAVRTFFDLTAVKTTETEDNEFTKEVQTAIALLNQISTATTPTLQQTKRIAYSTQIHKMHRHIIRLMTKYKIFALDGETDGPIKEVQNDY